MRTASVLKAMSLRLAVLVASAGRWITRSSIHASGLAGEQKRGYCELARVRRGRQPVPIGSRTKSRLVGLRGYALAVLGLARLGDFAHRVAVCQLASDGVVEDGGEKRELAADCGRADVAALHVGFDVLVREHLCGLLGERLTEPEVNAELLPMAAPLPRADLVAVLDEDVGDLDAALLLLGIQFDEGKKLLRFALRGEGLLLFVAVGIRVSHRPAAIWFPEEVSHASLLLSLFRHSFVTDYDSFRQSRARKNPVRSVSDRA